MSLENTVMGGIVSKGKKEGPEKDESKVETKAEKTTYIEGTHGSRTTKVRAEIRRERANRHKR